MTAPATNPITQTSSPGVETAVYARLSGLTALLAIVGDNIVTDEKWWDDEAAQTAPAVVFQEISGPREYTLRKQSGLVAFRIQIDCIGRTRAEANEIAEAVRLGISGFRGNSGGMKVQAVLLDDESKDNRPSPDNRDQTSFTVTHDYFWHCVEETPPPA